jgi:hypothetical protein
LGNGDKVHGDQWNSLQAWHAGGSIIPNDIGIEMDGDNHVCLYPTGNNVPISDIEPGHAGIIYRKFQYIENIFLEFNYFEII